MIYKLTFDLFRLDVHRWLLWSWQLTFAAASRVEGGEKTSRHGAARRSVLSWGQAGSYGGAPPWSPDLCRGHLDPGGQGQVTPSKGI